SQYRHGRLGLAHAAQGRSMGRCRPAAAAADQDRQAGGGLRPRDSAAQRRPPRRAGGRRISIPARHRTDHPRARRLVVSCPAPPPRAPPSDLPPATLGAMLARYGIALPKSHAVANAAEAVTAAERIGYPVALKIRSRDILHKTEVGGVAPALQSRDAVEAAAEALAASARAAQPSARIDGFP